MTTPDAHADEDRDFWKNTALAIDPDEVGVFLELFAGDLAMIREQAEALKDRPDISEADRRIAAYIFSGLESWSELVMDAEPEQK